MKKIFILALLLGFCSFSWVATDAIAAASDAVSELKKMYPQTAANKMTGPEGTAFLSNKTLTRRTGRGVLLTWYFASDGSMEHIVDTSPGLIGKWYVKPDGIFCFTSNFKNGAVSCKQKLYKAGETVSFRQINKLGKEMQSLYLPPEAYSEGKPR
jgi:hypothetical protein